MPKTYPSMFREQALALLASGRSIKDLAAGLGVSEATLYRWRLQDQVDQGKRPGITSGDVHKLRAARRRIRELEEELAATRLAASMLRDDGIVPKDASR